jgi:hypothetical protein
MSRRLVFRRHAEIELAEAVDWYGAQTLGLGADFLAEFDVALARIVENPFQDQIIEDEIRRAPMHRFPYGIVSDDELLILTCFYGSRDPGHWRELRR